MPEVIAGGLPLMPSVDYDRAVPNLTLVILEGQLAGQEFPINGTMLVGRDPAADLVLADTEISSKHASFMPMNGGVAVRDRGSTNGTFVNGHRLSGSQQLQAGDRVKLGGTVVEIRGLAPAAQPAAQPVAPHAQQVTRTKAIPTLPILSFVAGQLAGTEQAVGQPVVIGRDPGVADIVLDQDVDISRRHAVFAPAGVGLTVQDLGSTNGTIVNGHRLDYAVSLSTGDRVEVGNAVIDIKVPGQEIYTPAPTPVAAPAGAPGMPANDIAVEGLVKQYGEHRAVDGISLYVHPGEIYGFLGPNGAGKSTTVEILVTLQPPTAGTARVAGFDIVSQGPDVRSSIGVALQAAALDETLNAWEHMSLQTALQGIPKAERKQRAAELIERVGLTDAADRRVGGYSGGMKRRLDLALSLVHAPRVLFLDEPTTGLDPPNRTALWEEVVRLVKEEGTTVFLTTQYLEEADLMADRVGIIDHGEIVAEDTPERLKAEIGRPTVEVVPQDPNQWAAISGVLGGFGELASAANKGVAVRLRPGVEDLTEVIRALDAQGLRIAGVELHSPTLDDVFLAKTGRSIEGAGEDPLAAEAGVAGQLSGAGVPAVPGPAT
jgi:ABC-2 type transport system ATP-binding protein